MSLLFLEYYPPTQGILSQLAISGYYGLMGIHSEDIWNSTCILRHSRWSKWGGKKSFWSDGNKATFTLKLTNLRLLGETNFKLVIFDLAYTLLTYTKWAGEPCPFWISWSFYKDRPKKDRPSHQVFTVPGQEGSSCSVLAPSKEPDLSWHGNYFPFIKLTMKRSAEQHHNTSQKWGVKVRMVKSFQGWTSCV